MCHAMTIYYKILWFLRQVHLVKVHKMARENFALDEPEENPLLRPCLTIKEDVKPCPECDAEFANKTSLNVHRYECC